MPVDEFILKLDGNIREILLTVRAIVEESVEEAPQKIKWNALCFFKGDRPFVGIAPYTNHVSVIFDRGAKMKDEAGILEGEGKIRRYIKLHDIEEVANLPLHDYVRRSYELE